MSADAAALVRIETVLERLRRTNVGVVVVSLPHADTEAARDRAWVAARDAGRTELMTDAMSTARDIATRAFAGAAFSGTWAASEMSLSVASAKDRVAVATAFEDVTAAAVVEDLVDPDTLGLLRATFDELDRLRDLPQPGSLSGLTSSLDTTAGGLAGIAAAACLVILGILGLAIGSAFGVGLLIVAIILISRLLRRR